MSLASPVTATPSPWPLALLLMRLAHQTDLVGRLRLRGGGVESVDVVLHNGSVFAGPLELHAAQRAFTWDTGEFEILRETDQRQARAPLPMVAFVLAGLRPLVRMMPDADVQSALGARLAWSPMPAPARRTRITRMSMTGPESRVVAHDLDGSLALAQLLDANGGRRGQILRVVLLLEAFGCLAWQDPRPVAAPSSPRDQLEVIARRVEGENHFDALGLHWSASASEIKSAWESFRREFGSGSRWNAIAPDLTTRIIVRGERAWETLQNDVARARHRRELNPDVDMELLAGMVQSRALHFALQNDKEKVEEAMALLREIAPQAARDTDALIQKKKRSGAEG